MALLPFNHGLELAELSERKMRTAENHHVQCLALGTIEFRANMAQVTEVYVMYVGGFVALERFSTG